MCVSDQSHREASDDCEVHVEELSLGMVLEVVLAVPGALTRLVINSGNKAEVITQVSTEPWVCNIPTGLDVCEDVLKLN